MPVSGNLHTVVSIEEYNVKHEIIAAVRFCGHSILNFTGGGGCPADF